MPARRSRQHREPSFTCFREQRGQSGCLVNARTAWLADSGSVWILALLRGCWHLSVSLHAPAACVGAHGTRAAPCCHKGSPRWAPFGPLGLAMRPFDRFVRSQAASSSASAPGHTPSRDRHRVSSARASGSTKPSAVLRSRCMPPSPPAGRPLPPLQSQASWGRRQLPLSAHLGILDSALKLRRAPPWLAAGGARRRAAAAAAAASRPNQPPPEQPTATRRAALALLPVGMAALALQQAAPAAAAAKGAPRDGGDWSSPGLGAPVDPSQPKCAWVEAGLLAGNRGLDP